METIKSNIQHGFNCILNLVEYAINPYLKDDLIKAQKEQLKKQKLKSIGWTMKM